MSQFWNERFDREDYVYGLNPNAFFKSIIDDLKPGRILLPCEGEGRQAVYAAKLGWQVDAFDSSHVGQQKALALAEEMGVEITYNILNAEDFNAIAQVYDAIGLVFAHFSPDLRQSIHRNLISSLKPGGHLILEGFRKEQFGLTSGGPRDIDMLFNTEMLEEDFSSLDIDLLAEEDRNLDEGAFHQGLAKLIHLKAMRP